MAHLIMFGVRTTCAPMLRLSFTFHVQGDYRMLRRKVNAGTTRVRAAQNLVRGSTNLRTAVSKARVILSSSDMQSFVEWLPSVRRSGRGVPLVQHPDTVGDLWVGGALAPVDLAREAAWASAVACRDAGRLTAFRVMAERYEEDLVSGRMGQARASLDGIEATFGFSLWSIETRLALLQLAEGLEAQKGHAAAIRHARGSNDIVAYLAHLVSRRNEPSTTPVRYAREVEAHVAGWDDGGGLATYVAYRATNHRPTSPEGFAHVLRFEARSSSVDHYDSFVRLANDAASSGDERLTAAFRGPVIRAATVVDDERIRRVAFLLTGDGDWLARSTFGQTEAEDALVTGDYALAAESARTQVAADPLDVASWLTEGRSSAALGDAVSTTEDLRSAVTAKVRRLVERREGMDEAILSLLKETLNHRLQGFSADVEALLWDEMSEAPDPPALLAAVAFAQGRRLRPSDIGRMPTPALKTALAAAVGLCVPRAASLVAQLVRANLPVNEAELAADTGPLSPDAALEARTARALALGEHDEVLDLAGRLTRTDDLLRRRRARRFMAHSLLVTDQVAELASFIAASCVADPGSVGLLPLSECAKRLDKDARRIRAGDLATPIVLDLFSKRCDDSLDDVRAYAYEDLLLAHGCERPSQLAAVRDDFDRGLLVYYLRHLCVPGVMQVSSAYQGTRELEDERKSVLSLLVKIDPESSEDYEAELRDVTRAQLIHGGVRQVERSKIYVDVPAIRRAFEKAHKETYQRFQAMSRAGLGTDDRELDEALQDAKSGRSGSPQPLEVPANEANDLLLLMLRWLFTECTTNPEHGLDCYLSMRVRHGTLSGQLRTPLEVEGIITQRAATTEEYERNEHWTARLTHLDADTCSAIDECLATFSAGYDACIARVTSEMIQIRGTEKPNGLFNVNLYLNRFRVWRSQLTSDLTSDAFFERLMDLFWNSVEASLTEVRLTIDEQLKPEVNAMFADLERQIRELAGTRPTSDLDRAIRTAQTGTLQALDIVKDWFRLSQPTSEPDFPIGDLIDVGLQCVTAIHREFSPEVVRTVDPLPPFADALVLFSDIFFIIFDNIRRHSGLGPTPKVSIRVEDKGDRVRIMTRNEMSPVARMEVDVARVDAIRQVIARGDYQHAVRSEGGTGLIKLRKLISTGDHGRRWLEFGFGEADFYVDLELAKTEIYV